MRKNDNTEGFEKPFFYISKIPWIQYYDLILMTNINFFKYNKYLL